MILENTGISTYKVGSALGTNSRDIGTLCTHPSINMWSKWKPIESKLETITLDELKFKRYGLTILEANTPKQLVDKIKANGNIGVLYDRPKTKFRLGDFRNYNSLAMRTVETSEELYPNGEMKLGGLDSTNHSRFEIPIEGIEAMGTNTTIGVDELYNFTTFDGMPMTVRRGAYITDGVNSVWYTDKIFWWTTQMQQFEGKTVDVYEFYTNAKNTPSDFYVANGNDRFYALPEPHFKLKVSSKPAAGSKMVATILEAKFQPRRNEFDTPFRMVDYSLFFDARGDMYTGGELTNIVIKLSRDDKGFDTISQKIIPNNIIVKNNTKSETISGSLANNSNMMGKPSPDVFVCIFYNNKLQFTTQPMFDRDDLLPIE